MNAPRTGFAAYQRNLRLGLPFVPTKTEGEDPFRGLSGVQLLRAIRSWSNSGTKSVDYSEARRIIYEQIDNIDGKVTCVYTGRVYEGHKLPDANNMNIEHVWPQSKGAKGPAKSDMHHLLPTDNEANSKRGNLPFGIVTQPEWEKAGSVLGRDADGQECFYPRPEARPLVALATFHFAARWGFRIDAKQEAILRQWLKDAKIEGEMMPDALVKRSDKVAETQGKPNAFMAYPSILSRIDTFDPNADKTPRFGKILGFVRPHVR